MKHPASKGRALICYIFEHIYLEAAAPQPRVEGLDHHHRAQTQRRRTGMNKRKQYWREEELAMQLRRERSKLEKDLDLLNQKIFHLTKRRRISTMPRR
jgi:hypothetical protein